MKIGIDIRELERGHMTGIGRFLRNFISYVRTARPDYVFILYGNQHTETGLDGGNVIECIREEAWTQWWDQVTLPQMAHADEVDVFFSPYVKGPLRVRCPLVITIHDLMDLVFPEYSRSALSRWLFKQMASGVGRRADVVLADSEYSAADISRLLALDRRKVQVLPIGLEERYRPIAEAGALQKTQGKYEIKAPYIFCLSNFKPHKNVQGLIAAYAALPRELRARYQLALGGRRDRWYGERQQLARDLGVGDQVQFIGQVDEEDMPALYSGATLFVFPSIYEGFGLPPLEAMACGVPVLSSNRTSLPEVVGRAGQLFDPDEQSTWVAHIQRLLNDPTEREVWIKKGLEQAAHFRADTLCEMQMQIIESAGLKSGG